MIINHLDKLFVTSDAATIVSELEVQHPAAKLLVLAAKAQQEEMGDGANLVITLAGEWLQGAEDLLKSGLHPSEIVAGYSKATNKASLILPFHANTSASIILFYEINFSILFNTGNSTRCWNSWSNLWRKAQTIWTSEIRPML